MSYRSCILFKKIFIFCRGPFHSCCCAFNELISGSAVMITVFMLLGFTWQEWCVNLVILMRVQDLLELALYKKKFTHSQKRKGTKCVTGSVSFQ